ncbi:hypothetical protein ABT014_26820, partial [Kitasatospora sp. NPDC094015]
MRRLPLLLTTAALCGCLAAFGALGREGPAPVPQAAHPAPGPGADGSPLGRAIAADQQRLRTSPADAAGWSRLGAEYVEQARLTADP